MLVDSHPLNQICRWVLPSVCNIATSAGHFLSFMSPTVSQLFFLIHLSQSRRLCLTSYSSTMLHQLGSSIEFKMAVALIALALVVILIGYLCLMTVSDLYGPFIFVDHLSTYGYRLPVREDRTRAQHRIVVDMILDTRVRQVQMVLKDWLCQGKFPTGKASIHVAICELKIAVSSRTLTARHQLLTESRTAFLLRTTPAASSHTRPSTTCAGSPKRK